MNSTRHDTAEGKTDKWTDGRTDKRRIRDRQSEAVTRPHVWPGQSLPIGELRKYSVV